MADASPPPEAATETFFLSPGFIYTCTAVLGLVLVGVYLCRCRSKKIEIKEAAVIHCFLISAGMTGGVVLTVISAFGDLWPWINRAADNFHELKLYSLIGGILLIVTVCKQAKEQIFFKSPNNAKPPAQGEEAES